MSTAPQKEFKTAQYEFTDEDNRTFSGLADAMHATATLLQLLGVAFATLCGLQIIGVVRTSAGYVPAIGLGAAALFCLVYGYWTSSSGYSFRRIAETKNDDVWNLMNALRKLHHMYAILRFIIVASLVVAAIGLATALFTMFKSS